MPETRHQRVRKRLHIFIEGEEIPPPIKTFKVSTVKAVLFCFGSVATAVLATDVGSLILLRLSHTTFNKKWNLSNFKGYFHTENKM